MSVPCSTFRALRHRKKCTPSRDPFEYSTLNKAVEPECQKGQKGVKGAKGQKGQKGQKGHKGQKGCKGEKGEKGEKGMAGAMAMMGQKGDAGQKGEAGVKGSRGDSGDKGQKGVMGDKGQKGLRGDVGDEGMLAPGSLSIYTGGFTVVSGGTLLNNGVVDFATSIVTSSSGTAIDFPNASTLRIMQTGVYVLHVIGTAMTSAVRRFTIQFIDNGFGIPGNTTSEVGVSSQPGSLANGDLMALQRTYVATVVNRSIQVQVIVATPLPATATFENVTFTIFKIG